MSNFFNVTNAKGSNGYKGSVTLTEDAVKRLSEGKNFGSKFEVFCWCVEQNWTKAMIMKYALETTRDQYFYNYYNKFLANKSQKAPSVTVTPETTAPTTPVAPVSELRKS